MKSSAPTVITGADMIERSGSWRTRVASLTGWRTWLTISRSETMPMIRSASAPTKTQSAALSCIAAAALPSVASGGRITGVSSIRSAMRWL